MNQHYDVAIAITMSEILWRPNPVATGAVILTAVILCCVSDLATAQVRVTNEGSTISNRDSDIVVEGRRHSPELSALAPTNSLAQSSISTYGARSINELIERLQLQWGGRPFSILVDGHRISSLNDLGALPPEVLQSIETFAPGAGNRFGYSPTQPVLNLSLKKNFRTIVSQSEGGGSTDGAAQMLIGSLQAVRLHNGRRVNATIAAEGATGVLASERPRYDSDAADSRDRSLIPRSRRYTFTAGVSLPIGAGVVDFGVRGNASRSVGQLADGTVHQTNTNVTGGLSATYNRSFSGYFLSLTSDLNYSDEHAKTSGAAACATASPPLCGGQDSVTRTGTLSLAATMGGKALRLPAGDMWFNLSVNRQVAQAIIQDRLAYSVIHSRYGSTSAQFGLTAPVISPAMPLLGSLGQIDFAPSLSYDRVDGLGDAFGKNISINWSIARSLQINASVNGRTILPSNTELNAPAQTRAGVTVYDYRAGALVPVDQIVGGATLATQSIIDRRVSADYNTVIGQSRLAANLSYATTITKRPSVVLIEPSPIFERIFQNRFVRSPAGTLIGVDARPFNGINQTTRSLSGSINLSGRWKIADSSENSTGGIDWNLGVQGEHLLNESLKLAAAVPAIDTLHRPLSLLSGAAGRTRWTLQAGARTTRLSLNLSAAFTSGLTSFSLTNDGTGISVASLARIDTIISYAIRRHTESGRDSTAWRLQLLVKNALNARPRIEIFGPSGTSRLNPFLIDPLGRQILLSLRGPPAW